MKLDKKKIQYSIILILLCCASIFGAIGQSAIITLSFPFGARTTGLGETFTGIANSVDATFYNPAGLGQSPLASTWKVHTPIKDIDYSAIASKHKRAFGKKEKIWIGSSTKGLLLYNGRAWTSYEGYLIEENDNLRNIAEKVLNTDNDDLIVEAMNIIKKENKIEQKWHDKIVTLISPVLIDSLKGDEKAIGNIMSTILNLNESQRNAAQIFGIIASKVDPSFVDSISDEVEKVFQINDTRLSDLVELKIPFRIAVKDSITALTLDASDRLWVGTNKGLWRYNGSAWNYYSILDGLPSNRIIAVAAGKHQKIAVATDKGASIYSQGKWESFNTNSGLPSQGITSLTFGENDILYVGTETGLFKKDSTHWQVLDSTKGLLSSEVSALMMDSENNLWVGCKEGIAVYNNVSWKRYKFPGSKINCFSEFKPGKVWIGTNKGAISYQSGKIKRKKDGKTVQEPPRWKPFHSKNALEGNDVRGIAVHGKDIWLVTEKAVNQYD
ncbi:MAG: two-component regulator propeller domain-containing protein, partial [Chitinispirillia bacterium]